jgi:predicted dehydrogenase
MQSLAAGFGVLLAPSVSRSLWAADDNSAGAEQKKLGVALVGLGGYASGQLAPALEQTRHCRLAGIVTGTPAKAERWQKRYNLPAHSVYNYDTMERLADNPDVDIVYIVTPNALHAEHCIKAAKAGKHVICEKPMATSVEDCDRMIAACKSANRKLGIGYRLHYEPHTQEVARLGTTRAFGAVKTVKSEHSFHGRGNNWRYHHPLSGGGPLMDVGIYSVQGVMMITGEEPVAITAKEHPKTDPQQFRDVEETIEWTMEFPSGARGECITSYARSGNLLRADAEKGWFELSPAFSYGGIEGRTSNGPLEFPRVNQQALQMDAFAQHVRDGAPNLVPGEMGRRDVRILMAIYEAAKTGKPVRL